MFRKIILLITTSVCLLANLTITDNTLSILYSDIIRSPLMVEYNVTSEMINKLSISKRFSFYKDTRLPSNKRVGSKEYSKSGYDRGHLAPDATFDYNSTVLRRVYTMANVIPMLPKINRKAWLRVEKLERKLALKYGVVKVINLVRFDKGFKLLKNKRTIGLPIPTGYYKMFMIKDLPMSCYYYKNSKPIVYSLQKHKVNCEEVTFGSYFTDIKEDTDG